jgi:hypothetical protein
MTTNVNISKEFYFNVKDYYHYENYDTVPDGIVDIMTNYDLNGITAALIFNHIQDREYRKFGVNYKVKRDFLLVEFLKNRMDPEQISCILGIPVPTVKRFKSENSFENQLCNRWYKLQIGDTENMCMLELNKENIEQGILNGKTIVEMYKQYGMSRREFVEYCKFNDIDLKELVSFKKIKRRTPTHSKVITNFEREQFIQFMQEQENKTSEQFILDFENGEPISTLSTKYGLTEFSVRNKILKYYNCDTIKIIRKYLKYREILLDIDNGVPMTEVLKKHKTVMTEVNSLLREYKGSCI